MDITGKADTFDEALKDAVMQVAKMSVADKPVPFELKSISGEAGFVFDGSLVQKFVVVLNVEK